MKFYTKLLVAFLGLFSMVPIGYAQEPENGFRIKSSITVGFSHSLNNLVQFPLGYTDAQITPDHHQSRIGYQVTLAGLKELNNVFSIGVMADISKFGFLEYGNELNFWSNHNSRYVLLREFKMYGFGITSGIDILENEVNRLSTYLGIKFEEFISTQGVYIWGEEENQSKYAVTISMEYSHVLSPNMSMNIGLNSVISLKEFYTSINYKPIRYGISIGAEYIIR